ncbi:MAG: hypothetical protein MI746_06190 [Pseudomonadales bacterium]|nr:hypothetical protein [Pseudomonadales bacterium]
MHSRLREEQEAQAVWRYKPEYQGERLAEQLLANEFADSELLNAKRQRALQQVLEHAYDTVPYYRHLWFQNRVRRRQLGATGTFESLPLLSKADLVANYQQLKASRCIADDKLAGISKTSGTTGQPVKVDQSLRSRRMFAWLKQRELRWFRFDPALTHLSIRPGEELAIGNDGRRWPDGKVLKLECWPYLQSLFQTGPAFGFASTNAVAQQVRILEEVKPDYLLIEPATLENLAMQSIDDATLAHLQGVQVISQTLTADMRATIKQVMQTAILQNYGFNEIGLVASLCREGGRYHVHDEHALVEILTESDQQAAVGERGKLVVTCLTNSAMPLIRYDSGDSAVRADDLCECGRTSPSFIDVEGRYRRLAQLPPGSYQLFKAIQAEVNHYARNKPGSVFQYQFCQMLQGRFELIMDCSDEAFADLSRSVNSVFEQSEILDMPATFEFVRGRQFRGLEKRKFQIFWSELMPDH